MGHSLPRGGYAGGMPDTYRIITARYMRDASAIAVERVPRGENPMLPESQLLPWRDAEPWPVPKLAHAVARSGLVRHDEAVSFAGWDDSRLTAYFVCRVR